MKAILINLILITYLILGHTSAKAQTDDLLLNPEIEKLLNEIVVTATKTKRQLSTTTVPVTLVSKKDIENTNALRIKGVLDELTGINMVPTALGTGVQIQGLDSDYSLIMLDGVPIIGRLNGVLDLSRLSISNISHIEIVKGPSSVLFGSNALAGVINIITKAPNNKKSINLNARASSFNTYDLGANVDYAKKKYKGTATLNYYSTQGYQLTTNYQGLNSSVDYYGKTVSPHSNYTLSSQHVYEISPKIKFNWNTRYFSENATYKFIDINKDVIQGNGDILDWTIKPWITFHPNAKIKSKLRYNYNKYQTNTTELYDNENVYSRSNFDEYYSVIEWQNDIEVNKSHEFTLGGGYEEEGVRTSRLEDNAYHRANNKYLYLQYIFTHKENLSVVVGSRYENHQNYSSQFNPKLSVKYSFNPKYVLKASLGRGFKKPDFKQLFFNYTNNAIGYSVFGTTYVEEGMADLLAKNEIAIDPETGEPVIYDFYNEIVASGGIIDAESSTGLNLGLSIRSIPNTIIDLNLFRNDLSNLIESTPIALKTNGWQAYSYRNINRTYTQGIDIDMKYYFNDKIKLSVGYQYLEAKDKKIVRLLKEGKLFAKNLQTGVSYKIAKNQYGGLLNRPNHSANFKVFITDLWKGLDANMRIFYNGKFGFGDLNNNQILDIKNEYVPGYMLVNVTLQKAFFNNRFILKCGIDNLLDYTYSTPEFTLSSLPGRIFYTSFNFKFTKK